MALPEALPAPSAGRQHRVHHLAWLWVLLGGAAVWIAGAAVTAVTDDDILVPTLILAGSFLVPVSMVIFALTREGEDQLPEDLLILGFVVGGTVGVVIAAFVETYLLPTAAGTFIMVGVIEELTKAAIVVAVGSQMATRRGRDGMVLGATVGAGFSAFESAGYAFSALMHHQDEHPVINVLQTEVIRAVLAPFGHITWTAIFGGALFLAARSDGRFRVTWPLTGTLVGVITLHALWDQSYGWAILITQGLRDSVWELDWPATEDWVGAPTGNELLVWQVVYDGLLAVVAAVGVWWVVHNWRTYGRREARAAASVRPG